MKRFKLPGGYVLETRIKKGAKRINHVSISISATKLHFGPGPNWKKPDQSWFIIDIEPEWADLVMDINKITSLPFLNGQIDCIYASHFFEHVSIFKSPLLMKECYRVLKKDGILRIIIPDVLKTIAMYMSDAKDYKLFERRRAKAKDYTLFECLRSDFISVTGQPHIFGNDAIAHQNAWDYATLERDLIRAGFELGDVYKMGFQRSMKPDQFKFEGTYESEANEDYRSLYVEAIK